MPGTDSPRASAQAEQIADLKRKLQYAETERDRLRREHERLRNQQMMACEEPCNACAGCDYAREQLGEEG